MMTELPYLIDQVRSYLTEPRPISERVITSKHFTGWIQDRLQKDQQVLLNAIICREGEMQDRLNTITNNIEREFDGIAAVKVLPFPCNDPNDLPALVKGLLDHFNSTLTPEDIIQKIAAGNTRAGDYTGYLIVTIVQKVVIV